MVMPRKHLTLIVLPLLFPTRLPLRLNTKCSPKYNGLSVRVYTDVRTFFLYIFILAIEENFRKYQRAQMNQEGFTSGKPGKIKLKMPFISSLIAQKENQQVNPHHHSPQIKFAVPTKKLWLSERDEHQAGQRTKDGFRNQDELAEIFEVWHCILKMICYHHNLCLHPFPLSQEQSTYSGYLRVPDS